MDPKPLKIAPRSPSDLGRGAIVDARYKVVEKVGAGGSAVVYDVEHLRTGRRLALKMLLDPDQAPRLEQEARATAKLRSRHVARVVDLGNDRGTPYLVMTLLHGVSMRTLLTERKTLDLKTAANVVLQVAECLDEAHTLGLVHRDLKPDNIHLSPISRAHKNELFEVTVLDFGVVKLIADNEEPSALTRTGSTVGTPYYMSLEQLRGSASVDAQSDIYSLCVLLYEAFTGTVPFTAATLGDLVFAMISAPPVALRVVRPELPELICDLVTSGLSSKKEDRPKSMRAIADAFMPHAEPAFSLWLRGGVEVDPPTVDTTDPARAAAAKPGPPRPLPAAAPPRPPAAPKPDTDAQQGPTFGGAAAKLVRASAAGANPINVPAVHDPIESDTTDDDPPTRAANVSLLPNGGAVPPPKPSSPRTEARARDRDTPTEMFVKAVHGELAPAGAAAPPQPRAPDEPSAFPTMNLDVPPGGFGDATAVLDVPPEVAQAASASAQTPAGAIPAATPSYAFVPPPTMSDGRPQPRPPEPSGNTLVSPGYPMTDQSMGQVQGHPHHGMQQMPLDGPSALPSQTFGQLLEQALGQFRAATRGQRIAVVSGGIAIIAIFVMIVVILARK